MDECKWIDAKERLPDKSGRVIISGCTAGMREHIGKPDWNWVEPAMYNGNRQCFMSEGVEVTPSPTHWMPLPSPPSEEEQTEVTTLEAISSEPVMTVTLWGMDAILAFWARGGEAG